MGQSRKSVRKPRRHSSNSPIKYSEIINGVNVFAAMKREDDGWEYAIERENGGQIQVTRSLPTLAAWVYPAPNDENKRKALICKIRKAINA